MYVRVCVRCCLIPFISAVLPPVQEPLLSRIAPGQSKLFYNRTCMHWNMSPLIRCFAQHILKVLFLKTYIYKLYDNILSRVCSLLCCFGKRQIIKLFNVYHSIN